MRMLPPADSLSIAPVDASKFGAGFHPTGEMTEARSARL